MAMNVTLVAAAAVVLGLLVRGQPMTALLVAAAAALSYAFFSPPTPATKRHTTTSAATGPTSIDALARQVLAVVPSANLDIVRDELRRNPNIDAVVEKMRQKRIEPKTLFQQRKQALYEDCRQRYLAKYNSAQTIST